MITIYTTSNGAMLKRVASTDGENMSGKSSVADPPGYSDITHRWDATTKQMVADVSRADGPVCSPIDAERAVRRMPYLTMIQGQEFIYAMKALEVSNWYSLGGSVAAILTAVGLLSTAQKNARFRFALKEAAVTGDTLQTVIARFEAGAAAALDPLADIDARAVTAKRAVRAASTMQAKQAAANVSWG